MATSANPTRDDFAAMLDEQLGGADDGGFEGRVVKGTVTNIENGFAHIDVHNVRTKPEAFMVVLTPEGVVRSVRILAFHEPLDYLPTDRWYGQFQGKQKGDTLRIGGDLHGVVGATLSARAAADGVRRMLAYYEILLKGEAPASTPAEASSSATVAAAPEALGPDGSASED